MKKSLLVFSLAFYIFFSLPLAVYGLELPNPIACDTLPCIFINVMRLFLGALGVFALFVFMWGGFQMLTSAGNAETVKKAKDTLVWASVGIAVVISSWAIINYFLRVFITVTT
ncbi:MAG: hypothetical protein ABIH38_05715 [Patescibacteria group bacterium]